MITKEIIYKRIYGKFKDKKIDRIMILNYKDIIGFKLRKEFLGLSFIYRITIIHKNKKIHQFLELGIYKDNKNSKIINIFNDHNIMELKHEKY